MRLIACTIVAIGWACGCASTRDVATFRIHTDQIIARDFVGFGGEMNPYLYCRPNWAEPTYAATQPAQGAVNERNIADFERKFVELAPQHVRIFFLLHWWTPTGDYEIAKGDPRMIESFLRTVRLAQRAGATVNLTLWYGPHPNPDESGRKFAQIVTKLIREQGLDCIRYLTIQNEPNGDEVVKLTFDKYRALYLALDGELRKLGMRNRVKIISGDLLSNKQEKWFNDIAAHLAGVSDGYSIHCYWFYWNSGWPLTRLSEVRRIVDSLSPERRRPLYVTEFGVRGHTPRGDIEPGWFPDGTPVADSPRQALQIAMFHLLALKFGFVASVQWELYDAWYDRLMPYGTIGDATTGWRLKPAYHLLRLLTHTTRPGWDVLRVEGTSDDVIVAAMKGDGEMTVFGLNSGQHARRVRIEGLPLQMQLLTWSGKAIGAGKGASDMTLPPQALAVLTTVKWRPGE